MSLFRSILSLFRGTCDEDAFKQYREGLLKWADRDHDLSRDEYRRDYENRYVDAAGQDLFLDYLLSASKDSASYITDHPGLLKDRRKLFDRFGLPILTMHELRDKENERLARMESPLRL